MKKSTSKLKNWGQSIVLRRIKIILLDFDLEIKSMKKKINAFTIHVEIDPRRLIEII